MTPRSSAASSRGTLAVLVGGAALLTALALVSQAVTAREGLRLHVELAARHERKQLEEQLIHSALHDPLTGLANRALFADRRLTYRRNLDKLGVPVSIGTIRSGRWRATWSGSGRRRFGRS